MTTKKMLHDVSESPVSHNLVTFAHTCSACVTSAAVIERAGLTTHFEISSIAFEPKTRPKSESEIEDNLKTVLDDYTFEHEIISMHGLVDRSIFFTTITMLTRVVDSFEIYLKSMLELILTKEPRLILPSNPDNNTPSISFEILLNNYESSFEDFKSQAIRAYISKITSGTAYSEVFKFLKNKINGRRDILDEQEEDYLKRIFRIRNEITHKASILLEDYNFIAGTDHTEQPQSIDWLEIFKIAKSLIDISIRLEDVLSERFYSEEDFPANGQTVINILLRSAQIIYHYQESMGKISAEDQGSAPQSP